MRKLLLLAFGCMVAFPALTQTPDWSNFYEQWKFAFGRTTPITLETKGYMRIVLEPVDTATWIYTITRVKKQWPLPVPTYDSTWTATDIDDNNAAITYAPAGAWVLGTGLAKFLNGSMHYGSGTGTTARTATYTVTSTQPVRIGFYSERFNTPPNTHGAYTVKVGSLEAVTINAGLAPLVSDKDRGKASYRSPILPAGTYTVTVSTSQQMVVDFIKVEKLSLTPRP